MMKRQLLSLGALLVIVLFGTYMVRHIFAPGLPMGWDTPGHYMRAKYFSENPSLNGWFAVPLMGHPLFQSKPPLPYVLPSLVNLLTLGVFGFENAFKITMVLFYALLPVAIYFFARSFGLGLIGGLSSALFSLFVGNFWGAGIASIFGVGLFTHAPAIILWLVSMALIHRALVSSTMKGEIVAGMAVALLVLTHLFSTYYLAISISLYLFIRLLFERKFLKDLYGIIRIGAVAFFLSAFWVIPFVVRLDYHGMIGPWSSVQLNDVVKMLLDGSLSGDKAVTVLGVMGLIIAASRRKFSDVYISASAVITLLLASGSGNNILPFDMGIFSAGLSVRFFAFAVIYFALLAGISLEQLVTFIWKNSKIVTYATIGIIALLFIWTSIPKLESTADWLVNTENNFPNIKYAQDAALWMGQNTAESTRTASEFSWSVMKYGTPHIGFYIPIYSKRNELRGFAEDIKTSSGTVQLTDVQLGSNSDMHYLYTELFKYGVGYLLTYKEDTNRKFTNSNRFFKKTFEANDINVFELSDHPNSFLTSDAKLLRFTDSVGRFEYTLDTTRQNQIVSIAVSYYPNWNVYIDGKKGVIFQTEKNLMKIVLPEAGTHNVKFEYKTELVENLSIFISFAAWTSVALFILSKKRSSIFT